MNFVRCAVIAMGLLLVPFTAAADSSGNLFPAHYTIHIFGK